MSKTKIQPRNRLRKKCCLCSKSVSDKSIFNCKICKERFTIHESCITKCGNRMTCPSCHYTIRIKQGNENPIDAIIGAIIGGIFLLLLMSLPFVFISFLRYMFMLHGEESSFTSFRVLDIGLW